MDLVLNVLAIISLYIMYQYRHDNDVQLLRNIEAFMVHSEFDWVVVYCFRTHRMEYLSPFSCNIRHNGACLQSIHSTRS